MSEKNKDLAELMKRYERTSTRLREWERENETRELFQRETHPDVATHEASQVSGTFVRVPSLRWSFEGTVVPGPDTIQ